MLHRLQNFFHRIIKIVATFGGVKYPAIIFSSVLALTLIVPAFGAGKSMRFLHLTQESSDLCSNSVNVICSDDDGMIWIGTNAGLNRFDGISTKSYRIEEMKTESNDVTNLVKDSQGNIWIGTKGGISVFRKDYGEFCIPILEKGERLFPYISSMSVNPNDGSVWIGTNEGILYSCDNSDYILKSYDTGLGKKIKGIAFPKSSNMLVLGNYGEIFQYDIKRNVVSVPDFKIGTALNRDADYVAFCADPENRDIVFAVSKNCRLLAIDFASKEVKNLCTFPRRCIPYSIFVFGKMIFLATKDGLVRYDILNLNYS